MIICGSTWLMTSAACAPLSVARPPIGISNISASATSSSCSSCNTIYVIHMDDLVICHLGDLGHTLQEEQLEEVADADILLIPIGGRATLNGAQAAEVISQVEPHIIIPMHYYNEAPETPEPLDKFSREMGIEVINTQPKLTVTRNSLPAEPQVVILSQRS